MLHFTWSYSTFYTEKLVLFWSPDQPNKRKEKDLRMLTYAASPMPSPPSPEPLGPVTAAAGRKRPSSEDISRFQKLGDMCELHR